jgi:hypothetical protein
MNRQTVTINGRVYDVRTGQLVRSTTPQQAPSRTSHPVNKSHAIHQTPQKSQTLNRQIVQKAAPKVQSTAPKTPAKPQKSPAITKFAPHPAGAKTTEPRQVDIAPVAHPIAAKAQQQQTAVKQQQQTIAASSPKPSHIIKQEAVEKALQQAPDRRTADKHQPKKKRSRLFSLASAGLALLLLGGYFTYLNMPSLSVRVAAAQAGVDASYPGYHPDGYSLNGPVAFSDGQVNLKFAANAGDHDFTISQSKSSWDSSAVFENYVKEKAGENYITYSERGLTIYTYGGNAAWVTDGILYTIEGDAPLSGDQIRQIATSL